MISDNIKRLRENAGLSQAALARKLGVTRASVNAWEMELSAPTAQYLIALAQLFHTTTDDIEYYGKMSELQDMAGENFFRPHRAYLINMRYVERYDSSHIYLEKGQVTMAKQNYKCFVESYMKYSMRGIGE